ncbi:hypothetical protein D5R40_28775 [Okeania hirsuta]|uniref:RRXRR domain-containing protein n=1 Tax=Okeania hirsuta TaxID=1458930 RepID=A0A3N6P1C9_9CYAN|nr:hypothetical protein D5R40_28775 [Okeania hirsuta]
MSRFTQVRLQPEQLIKYCPITELSQEIVRFDTQLMQSPEISGVEYQQGELHGYELREYLLENEYKYSEA